ncbi:YeeE/YedE thiosulfate transporter family protein [Methanocorpusculum sp. MG]|uniref:YeeE/YedE thiosulfate transporter family protein n=1 Tax=Methanocorpusculum petauri TaxID=3002863 RepID=A0ABT4IFS2_9EURY|nr:YeeE/YedE thiosulfate transporter family protein [Methanocorpusculum petauri]MCZ0860585.1 YeeE/YedE thiosulfate transporter family protein [Methanocorpusculum petauri]
MVANSSDEKKGLDSYLKMPLVGGAVIGFAAALIQALLFAAGGPQAYGFCVACHSRDLINYVYNSLTGSNLFLAPFSANPVAAGTLPVLTIIGVLVGAVAAAVLYKEFRVKKGDAKSYVVYGIGGILFMIFALCMGACPYRLALRIGYGDLVAVFGLIAIIVGIYIGIKIALKRMED